MELGIGRYARRMLTHMVQPEEKKGFGEEGRTFGCKNADGTVHGYNYARKNPRKSYYLAGL
jgi:hypothetical protein